MKRFTLVSAALVLVVTSRATVQAQEMLVNGDLNQTHQLGSPALYYPELVGWTHTTNPNSNFPAPIVPYVPGQFYTQYAGYPAGFADRLNPGTTGQNGLTGTSFEGYYPFEIVGPVDLEISHTHAATPGELYRFSGWAHFEGGYAGG
ncbi:MAG TPA: hypothetical protein PK402_06335, partial [Tepidisphaeraceae bacterium]|nr:hypothetical protein [Tepidisphaeraceae bacterium]